MFSVQRVWSQESVLFYYHDNMYESMYKAQLYVDDDGYSYDEKNATKCSFICYTTLIV